MRRFWNSWGNKILMEHVNEQSIITEPSSDVEWGFQIVHQYRMKNIDCTVGGFSKEILNIPQTKVIAIDRDKKIKLFATKLENFSKI